MNWQPRPFQEKAEPHVDPFSQKPESMLKAQVLLARYDLSNLRARATSQRFLENLTYLEWLDTFYQASPQRFDGLRIDDCLNWLDAGSKNWSYVDALDAFIRKYYRSAYRLDGVELDPHRRYTDFTTRQQVANAYASVLPNAQYHGMDLLDWRRKAHIITHFLPFVAPDPHLAWGLPLAHFQPQQLLNYLLGLLEPGGVLLVVNQGAWEAEAQQKLWEQASQTIPLQIQSLGQLPTSFIEYRYPRFGWICVKQED